MIAFCSTTSLAQFEAKLCDFGFFRVHRRYIVNLACVTDVETVPSGAIQLGITGVDERVPVSRRRVVPLKNGPESLAHSAPHALYDPSSGGRWVFLYVSAESFFAEGIP